MKVKMSEKVISIPPYLSTTWDNVQSLHLGEGDILEFSLVDGSLVKVPGLDGETIQAIFDMHVKVSEKGGSMGPVVPGSASPGNHVFDIPMGMDLSGLEGIGSMMQHNPDQSNSPDLPPEVLKKVAGIAGVIGEDEMVAVPQPVSGCNCFYCQIVRAIHSGVGDLKIGDAAAEDDESG